MSDCNFCAIVAGQAPASIVYRDDLCTAFLDIQPVNPGHLLVVPNDHATYLADLPPATGGRLFGVSQHLGAALRKSGLHCEGVNLFLADGEAAMQEVFHVHLHVFPRFAGDGFGLTFSPTYLPEAGSSRFGASCPTATLRPHSAVARAGRDTHEIWRERGATAISIEHWSSVVNRYRRLRGRRFRVRPRLCPPPSCVIQRP